MNFRIEKMSLEALDEVMKIEALSYGEHHWSRDSFVGELNNQVSSYNCIISEDNRYAGYMGLWKIIDEAHVTNLAIHPDFRRMGAGGLLMLNALSECYKDKIKYLTLEVRASNIAAIALYEKFGFKSLGLRKKYYQNNNEDALIMWSENIFNTGYKEKFEELKKSYGELLIK